MYDAPPPTHGAFLRGGHLSAGAPEEYCAAVEALVMAPHELDALLVALSDVHKHLRQLQAERDMPALASCQDTLPASALRFKLEVMRHLPILLFAERPRLQFGRRVAVQPPVRGVRDSDITTSVYWDDAALGVYRQRLERSDGATVVRVRWYGPRAPGQPLFVERKVHRESWMGEESAKQREALTQSELERFLATGAPPPEIGAAARQYFAEVAAFLGTTQTPLLQTRYRRTAFQESDTNDVRVSLDMELCMAHHTPGTPPCCRAPVRCAGRGDGSVDVGTRDQGQGGRVQGFGLAALAPLC